MQLKKLEMCGFKSFANKTAINFEPGVTVVVGPNGSGKSNVVDAIKWVLGTLSYKSVRGDEMMDVVFKGGGGMGPAGFAEVSLTLDNSDRALSVDFSEVVITRRLHRDGVGEYYINGTASRLKDIRDLLYGTGIGTDNYSIIEQGKIDKLVTTDPRGRRIVFDEAAGISKYRARRKETEQRLEKVSGDMERLGMLIGEVRSQLRSVRGQAGRAARYKEMKDQFVACKTKLIGHEYRQFQAQAKELADRLAALEADRQKHAAEIEAVKAELAKATLALEGLDARAAEVNGKLSAASSRSDYLASTIQQAEVRLGELSHDRERAEKGRADAAARVEECQTRKQKIEAESTEMERTLEELRARLSEAQERLCEAVRECRQVREELDVRKAQAIELAHKESTYNTDLNQTRADAEGLARRRERTQSGAAAAQKELGEARAKLDELSTRCTALETEIQSLKNRLAFEKEEQQRRVEERARLEENLVRLRAARDKCESRRETLKDLELAHEGLGSGARELLKGGFEGVRGTVVDLLEADYEHVPMVEAALGELAGAVIVDTVDQARQAVEIVRSKGLDRTTVIPLEACVPRDRRVLPPLPKPVERVRELVRGDARYSSLLDALLGSVIYVDTKDEAEALRDLWSKRGTIVTRAGDIYDDRGMMSAGLRKAGLLARKADLRKLETEISEVTRLIEEHEAKRRSLDEAIREGNERQDALRQDGYKRGVELSETKAQQEQVSKRCSFLDGQLEHYRADLQQMELQSAQLAERQQRLEGLLAELQGIRTQAEGEIAGLNERIARYEEGRAQLQADVTKASTERAQGEEKYRGLQQQAEAAARDMEQQLEAVHRNEEHLAEIEARSASVGKEIESHRSQQEELAREVESLRGSAESIEKERGEARARSEAAGGRMSELEQAVALVDRETQELRLKEARQQADHDNLVQRAKDQFQIDLSTLPAEEETQDWEALTKEANELEVKIAGFGTVNLVALEELKGLEEREADLVRQQEDIVGTKREMEELIRKLNTECRIKFEKTLEFVREEFNNIFRKIFGGGKADIVLEQTEGVDPMEQGLEIMARPPQKDQLPISLLSGGEKSLTAFALVMALFRANPSPFCILDEADAALDEKNVDRYAGLINEFVGETQFIVISHNKRTMSQGDVLYGVTMQTPGVSTLVNVAMDGGDGLELLKQRRERIRQARAESNAKKAQAIAELQSATATALAEAEGAPEAGESAIPTAPEAEAASDEPPANPGQQ